MTEEVSTLGIHVPAALHYIPSLVAELGQAIGPKAPFHAAPQLVFAVAAIVRGGKFYGAFADVPE